MSWDYEKLIVRQGPSIGKSSELRMLDAIGGASTIKKRFQNNLNGSVTMAHTRGPGAQPEFITSEPTNEVVPDGYLESGQLSIGDFGTSNPNRNNKGNWDASLLPNRSYGRWIGLVEEQGAQKNSPAIIVAQDSKSLGGAELSNTDYYEKKMCIQNVPPSMFTGRTRLWVQALYGTKFTGTWSLRAVSVGQPYLYYGNGIDINSTFSLTSIIYFDSLDDAYFLLNVTSSIRCYPMKLPGWAKKLSRKITTSGWTAAEKERAEAYVLSVAVPDTGKAFTISGGDLPTDQPIAYGWKSNWKGDKLDMVAVHEEHRGPGASDYRFISNHYRISLTRDTTVSETESARWSYVVELVEGPVEWVALFGFSNLWVPRYKQFDNLLKRYEGDTYAEQFSFSAVPIYCFYDASDTLVVVRYSHQKVYIPATATYSYSGRRGGLPTGWDYDANAFKVYGPYYTCEAITNTGHSSQQVSVDFGSTVSSHKYNTTGMTRHVYTSSGQTIELHTYATVNPGADSPDYAEYTAAVAFGGANPTLSVDTFMSGETGSSVLETGMSEVNAASCALVVPFYDCEAFYSSSLEIFHKTSGMKYSAPLKYTTSRLRYAYTNGVAYSRHSPTPEMDAVVITYPADFTGPTSSQNVGVNKYGPMAVTGPLYGSLHDPDRAWAFSSAIHSTHTSAFGAACGTDIASDPADADLTKTFVGGI